MLIGWLGIKCAAGEDSDESVAGGVGTVATAGKEAGRRRKACGYRPEKMHP